MHNRSYYHLTLKNSRITSIKLDGAVTGCFKKPATDKNIFKLYIVKYKSKIIYVGFTKQNIRNRLRYGFSAEGKRGYYGYKWKNLTEVDLCIWYFPWKENLQVEAIEAELVYLVRKNTGKWPEYQTEIHFRNPSKEDTLLAESIYKEIAIT